MEIDLQLEWEKIRAEAAEKAGEPGDIPQRAQELHKIFLDSGKNHTFPEVALHGALWAYGYFESKGKLGQIIQWRYFYNAKERGYRMGLLSHFAEIFKTANRKVFIDTYSNYFFSKRFGRIAGVEAFIPAELLSTLNEMHEAREKGLTLSIADREKVYVSSLKFEQERSVSPILQEAFENFSCPILTWLCMKPVVRFRYFPKTRIFWFKDFANQPERINRAIESLRIAEAAGWDKVASSMHTYGVNLP